MSIRLVKILHKPIRKLIHFNYEAAVYFLHKISKFLSHINDIKESFQQGTLIHLY